jgi:hypothetical protein
LGPSACPVGGGLVGQVEDGRPGADGARHLRRDRQQPTRNFLLTLELGHVLGLAGDVDQPPPVLRVQLQLAPGRPDDPRDERVEPVGNRDRTPLDR